LNAEEENGHTGIRQMGGACSMHGDMKNLTQFLAGKPEWMGPFWET
jgi:hypothetical protein